MQSFRTMTSTGLCFIGVCLLGTADVAEAQFQPTVAVNPAAAPWFLGGGSYGGGTVDGNFMFGAAQVIRAAGDYNALSTQGMINFEMARSRYIDNAVKWSQFYGRMREANEAYKRQKYESSRHSPEILAQVAASDIPRVLGSDELDPVTGKLFWPEALTSAQFSEERAEIERLLELTVWTTRTPEMVAQLREEIRKMREHLRTQMEDIPAADYIVARKFLDSLEYSVISRRRSTPTPPAPLPAGG